MSNAELPRLAPKEQCTGCGACAAACPVNAIRMAPDREGFLYPSVTHACTRCGQCAQICPALNERPERNDPAVFAAWNDDENVRMASTAGGVFALLADWVLEGGGVVFGAAVDENLRVRHTAARTKDELPPLLGGKPIQSELGDVFLRVREALNRGQYVLFSGTPCQVDGLYRFLGESPENLLTVDVVCRGASSPGVWGKLVRSMAYVLRKTPVDVSFYGKLSGVRERRFRVTFDDGSVYDAPYDKSELGRGQRRALFLRPSCHTCPYTSPRRVGDLTLGQFSGLPRDYRPEEQRKGVSLLLVNTARGARILDTLPLHREPRTLEEAMAENEALSAPPPAPAERGDFFTAFARQPFQQVRNRFLTPLTHRLSISGREVRAALRSLRKKGGAK